MPFSASDLRQEPDSLELVAGAMLSYLEEIEKARVLCERHEATAAIHDRGKALQLYRLFPRDDVTARHLRKATEDLPPWNEALYWRGNGSKWQKMRREIESRMARHPKQHPIITRGVEWDGLPILVHAYKFEPDPVMKLELVLADYQSPTPELPLCLLATLLQCHEHLVPEYTATALPPYERHDAHFLTIAEYLSRTMPKELYATECLQRVSCHAGNGVGSRDTLREHPQAVASHSTHGQTQTT